MSFFQYLSLNLPTTPEYAIHIYINTLNQSRIYYIQGVFRGNACAACTTLFFALPFLFAPPPLIPLPSEPLPCALMNSYFIINYQQWALAGTMFDTIFLFFFLTNKPFFQNLKFYLLLPDMGGCEKNFARFARGQVSHPPFQIPEYAPVHWPVRKPVRGPMRKPVCGLN